MNSESFFEVHSEEPSSMVNRLQCMKDFLKKCSYLPFILIAKIGQTFFRAVGVLLAAMTLVLTMGAERRFFIERVSSLARDLTDWILLPFAILVRTLRFLVSLIRPRIYFS